MDPREYVDARWHALVREAVDLGVPEEEAPALVQAVLASNQRRIRRAEDPDPLVRAALLEAVTGPEPATGRPWVRVGALVAALALVGVAVALTRPEAPAPDRLRVDQVPSLFGYDAASARTLLDDRGLRVKIQPFPACEVLGRVVGSDPPAGTPYDHGDPITVYTSLPADVSCLTDYQQRATAWQLLDFANDRGPAPPFGSRVFVYPGDGRPVVLDRSEASDRDAWAATGVLDGLRAASRQVRLVSEHPLQYAVPAVAVTPADDGVGSCGVPDPAVAGTGDAFGFLVRAPDRTACPVRVDVFTERGAIVALVFYPS